MAVALLLTSFMPTGNAGSFANAPVVYPKVAFTYSPIFDAPCSDLTKEPIDQEAVKELEDRLPSLEAYWRKDERALFSAVPVVTGIPFQFKETRAALILCKFQSMSIPLIINMRPYVSRITKETVPLPVFSNTVFHEVMHRYAADCIRRLPNNTTRLREKYKGESPAVVNHLHLYAIERLVYRKLGREPELQLSIDDEKKLRGGKVLARAREIVAAETAEALVAELKNK
jgi:hypothetical protein